MKKLIAFLACAAMLLALLAGCGSGTEVESYDASETEAAEAETETVEAPIAASPDGEEAAAMNILLGGTGYETFAPDTVVGTAAGTDITWQEYFYWLNYYTQYVIQLAAQYGLTHSPHDKFIVFGLNHSIVPASV